MRPD